MIGLTPEEIASVHKLDIARQEVEQKGLQDLFDAAFSTQVLAPYYRARTTAQAGRPTYPVTLSDGTTVQLEADEYASYQKEPDLVRQYKIAQKDPNDPASKMSFSDWKTKIAEAGATRIGLDELRKRKEMGVDVTLRGKFKEPKFREDVESYLADKDPGLYGPGIRDEQEFNRAVWTEMDRRIKESIPGAVFGKNAAGQVGWFDESGELVRAWP